MTKQNKYLTLTRFIPKVGIGILLLSFFVALSVWASHTHAFKLATSHQPERFTELYFTDPNKLPARIDSSKTYKQTFAVVNHEASSMTYTYHIEVSGITGKHVYPTQQIAVGSGQKVSVPFTYEALAPKTDQTVAVVLVSKNQSIHFRVQS